PQVKAPDYPGPSALLAFPMPWPFPCPAKLRHGQYKGALMMPNGKYSKYFIISQTQEIRFLENGKMVNRSVSVMWDRAVKERSKVKDLLGEILTATAERDGYKKGERKWGWNGLSRGGRSREHGRR
ncbi:hypothetical protein NHX12_011197, partial [Muraenolepis orangiensis]